MFWLCCDPCPLPASCSQLAQLLQPQCKPQRARLEDFSTGFLQSQHPVGLRSPVWVLPSPPSASAAGFSLVFFHGCFSVCWRGLPVLVFRLHCWVLFLFLCCIPLVVGVLPSLASRGDGSLSWEMPYTLLVTGCLSEAVLLLSQLRGKTIEPAGNGRPTKAPALGLGSF